MPKETEWIPLTVAAKAADVNERTMRRRMVALHQQLGGGVLRHYSAPGKRVTRWWVNPAALKRAIEHDPETTQVALGEHLVRIETVEHRTEALRQALHARSRNQAKQIVELTRRLSELEQELARLRPK